MSRVIGSITAPHLSNYTEILTALVLEVRNITRESNNANSIAEVRSSRGFMHATEIQITHAPDISPIISNKWTAAVCRHIPDAVGVRVHARNKTHIIDFKTPLSRRRDMATTLWLISLCLVLAGFGTLVYEVDRYRPFILFKCVPLMKQYVSPYVL
jgi:hypothetical protein